MSLIEEYQKEEASVRKAMRSAGFYSFLASIAMLAVPMFLFQVYNSVLRSRSIETLIAMAIFALVVLVAFGIFDAVRNSILSKAAVKMEARLSAFLLAGELSRQHGANAQSVRDVSALRQVVASPAFGALFDVPFIPIFLGLIFFIHPTLGFVVVMGAVVLVGMGLWADRSTAELNEKHMQAAMKSHQTLDMHMNSQEIIRAHGMYREVVNHWGKSQGAQLGAYIDATEKTGDFSSASKAVRQIVQVLMIGSGALLVLMNEATAGVIFATAMIGGRALSPVEQVVSSWRILKQGYDTRKRLLQRLEELSLPEDRTQIPRPKGRLSLERVVYMAQPGTPPVIKGVNGTIMAGDSVAIIGPSGAGKSTLARLLVGYLLPSAGRVTLDGQDLKAWDPVAKGLHIGYMPQQSTFFEATVRENIARLRVGDPEDLAIEAAKLAGVHDLLLKLPQGYDTVISKTGFYPSGGQAQLIALARAFYGNPAVIVLDEPNAALDSEGERVFHQALHTANKRGMTVIVVTQRPSVLKHVSKVMLMQDGAIKDFGPKDEVLKSGNVRTVSKQGQKRVGAQGQAADGQAKPSGAAKPTDAKPAAAKPASAKQAASQKQEQPTEVKKPQKTGINIGEMVKQKIQDDPSRKDGKEDQQSEAKGGQAVEAPVGAKAKAAEQEQTAQAEKKEA